LATVLPRTRPSGTKTATIKLKMIFIHSKKVSYADFRFVLVFTYQSGLSKRLPIQKLNAYMFVKNKTKVSVSANRFIDQSTNQLINQSTNPSINQSNNRPINQSTQ
jgi:hypothetical protein